MYGSTGLRVATTREASSNWPTCRCAREAAGLVRAQTPGHMACRRRRRHRTRRRALATPAVV